MAEVTIDAAVALKRVQALAALLAVDSPAFGGAGAVAFLHGKHLETKMAVEPFAVSVQRYLLGYEFPDTMIIVIGNTCYVHATSKKLEYLKSCAELATTSGSPVRFELIVRDKGDLTTGGGQRIIDVIKAAGVSLGLALTDPSTGIVASFLQSVSDAGIATTDATLGIERFLHAKDDEAGLQIRKAGALAGRVGRNVFVRRLEEVFDEETAETNAGMAKYVTDAMENLTEKFKIQVEGEDFDFLLDPVVQSGGNYSVHVEKAALVSSAAPFTPDVIIFSATMRWKQHSALVARTYFVDPSPSQQRLYDSMHEVQAFIIDELKPGVVVAKVVEMAWERVKAMPNIPAEGSFRASFGSSIGVRCIDKASALKKDNQLVVAAGMAFSVVVGMSGINLSDAIPQTAMSKLASYSIVIADTVIIEAKGGKSVTEKLPSNRSSITYNLSEGDDDEEEAGDDSEKKHKVSTAVKDMSRIKGGRTETGRSARLAAKSTDTETDDAARKARQAKQLQLFNDQREKALKRLRGELDEDSGAAGGRHADDEIARAPEIEAYKNTSDYPKGGRACAISIDKSHDALLVPLFGTMVPFHVSTIKSIVKSDEGHKAFLRINFYSSNQSLGKDAAPSMAAAVLHHPDALYIRTLNFMSRDHRNFGMIEQTFKAMQKKSRADRAAAVQQANLVEQHKLVTTRDAKVPRLQDINMWPAVSGRKTTGTLESHTNGLRFISSKGEKIDIVYGNIRHGIFQPCEKDHVVLVHFHLRHAIMVGKKKYKDVQFFTEVVEASQALDGRHKSDYDQDELHAEERERRLRIELNKAFSKFVQRTEEVAELDASNNSFKSFEVPNFLLSFNGAPFKEMSLIHPMAGCLASVVDKPPFVASVDDIEHVHFERVIYGSKNFDMVLIFREGSKDKGEDSFQRITAIPMLCLEGIKSWLTDIAEVTYSESTNPYVWKSIIDDLVRKPDFYLSEDEETGEKKPSGWTFLTDEGWRKMQGGEGEEEEEEGEEESDFEDDMDDEEEDDDDEDDFSDVVDDEDDDDDDDADDDDDDDEEDEGEDSEEMDARAEAEDKKRKRVEEEEDERDRARRGGKSSKHHSSSSSKHQSSSSSKHLSPSKHGSKNRDGGDGHKKSRH